MLPPTAPYRNILCDEAWRSPISSELKKDVTASRLETACRHLKPFASEKETDGSCTRQPRV